MATIEERLTALEPENAVLKKSDELQTIALQALATKDALATLQDTNNKVFDALISHDRLTNERLGNLQLEVIEVDGKVTGLQVATKQGFKDIRNQLVELDGKIVGQQVETRQGLRDTQAQLVELNSTVVQTCEGLRDTQAQIVELDGKITSQQAETRQGFQNTQAQLDQILLLLAALTPKPEQDA